jgi:aryl-alcohol dehydrogenase-like predicted oxidoreductase
VVSARLILGTVQWGQRYGITGCGMPDDAELAALLTTARAAGVATLDTARAYGTSEARLGALAAPASFEIQTKLAPDVCPDGADADTVRARTAASLAASRSALGVARLDAVLLHRAAHRRAAGGAAWDLLRLSQRSGRIGRLGVSAARPEEAWAALDDPHVQCIQVATSLLDQRLWRTSFFERAHRAGKQVQVRSVFLQGAAFLSPDALPGALARLCDPLHAIETWSRAHGLTTADAFLLFARAIPGATLVLGFERGAQLAAALATLRLPSLAPAACAELAALVPALGADVLDPSQWGAASACANEAAA